jgi:hypothetical protein
MEQVVLAMEEEWTPEIERHTAECAECRELLADRELLREAPLIPDTALAALRARVLQQVAPSPSWMWRAAAAAVLAAAGISWWILRPAEVLRMEVAVWAPKAPQLVRSRAATEKKVVQRREFNKPGNRPAALAMALRDAMGPETAPPVSGSSSVLVAVQTEDPQVMIVLVSESKGDGE